jgi:hypothetical protein
MIIFKGSRDKPVVNNVIVDIDDIYVFVYINDIYVFVDIGVIYVL